MISIGKEFSQKICEGEFQIEACSINKIKIFVIQNNIVGQFE